MKKYFYNPNKKMCQRADYIYNDCIDIEHILKKYKQGKGSLKAFHDYLHSQGIQCSREWMTKALKELKLHVAPIQQNRALKFLIENPQYVSKTNYEIGKMINMSASSIDNAKVLYNAFLRSKCETYEEFKESRKGDAVRNIKRTQEEKEQAISYQASLIEEAKATIERNKGVFPTPLEVVYAHSYLKANAS